MSLEIVTARLQLAAVLAVALCACGEKKPEPVTFHKDIEPLLKDRCGDCHVQGGIGPFPLQTYADFMAQKEAVLGAMQMRIMPPWPARRDCHDYAPDGTLSDEQIALVKNWAAAGALEGDPKQFVASTEAKLSLSRVDFSVSMPEAFTPTGNPDEYRCFILDWPSTETAVKYITGFAFKPGVPSMVHHADLFYINPEYVSKFQQKDDADPGQGYQCYSFPNPVDEGAWIGTFVPGSRGMDFPEGTGLGLKPGSKFLIQMHYNTQFSGGAKPDVSTLQLSLATHIRHISSVQAFADLNWISNQTMDIPAGNPDVMHRYQLDPTPYLSLANDGFTDGQPVKLYAATLHMHQLGKSAKVEIMRADGGVDCLADVPKWDFHWQLPYTLAAPVVVNPGDQVAVECHWDNSASNQPISNGVQQPPRDVNWGPNTTDEMCVAGIYISQ